jgi:hypothetical protein
VTTIPQRLHSKGNPKAKAKEKGKEKGKEKKVTESRSYEQKKLLLKSLEKNPPLFYFIDATVS